MKLRSHEIAIAGVMSAISVLLAVTGLGFIPFLAGTSITIMHVPVIIGAVISGPIVGTLIGLIFGVSSLILASVAPTGPGDVFFTDPLVSILPRFFIGLIAWAAYRLARSAGRVGSAIAGLLLAAVVLGVAYTVGSANFGFALWAGLLTGVLGIAGVVYVIWRGLQAHPEELALSLAALGGTLANTGFVLSALVLRGYIPVSVALAIGMTNGLLEIVAASIITVAVVAGWRQIRLRPGGSSV